jgi:hypothetical protein
MFKVSQDKALTRTAPRRLSPVVAKRDPRVAAAPVCTQFNYMGSAEQRGWEPGHVPLFLKWFPEKFDRLSNLEFFESGREYSMGRSPNCDFFFKNTEADCGISALHLKMKVPNHFPRCAN